MILLSTLSFSCLRNTRAIIQPEHENALFEYEFDSTLDSIDLLTCASLLLEQVDVELRIGSFKFTGSFYYSSSIQELILVPPAPPDFDILRTASIATYSLYFQTSANEFQAAVDTLLFREFNHGECIYGQAMEYNNESFIVAATYNQRCNLRSDSGVLVQIRINDFEHSFNATIVDLGEIRLLNLNCAILDAATGNSACRNALYQTLMGENVKMSISAQISLTFLKDLSVFDERTGTAMLSPENLTISQQIKFPVPQLRFSGADCFDEVFLEPMRGMLELTATEGAQLYCNTTIAEIIQGGARAVIQVTISDREDAQGRVERFQQGFSYLNLEEMDYFIDCASGEIGNMTADQCNQAVERLFDFPDNSSVEIVVNLYNNNELIGAIRFPAIFREQNYYGVVLHVYSNAAVIRSNAAEMQASNAVEESANMKLWICESEAEFYTRECPFSSQIVVKYPNADEEYVFPLENEQRRVILDVTAQNWFGFVESKALRAPVEDFLISVARPELWQAYLVLPCVLLVVIIYYILDYFVLRKMGGSPAAESLE